MTASLGYVLGEGERAIYLPLLTMELKKLDEFVTTNFCDASEVRKMYQEQIEEFRRKNHAYISRLVRQPNGRIVLYYIDNKTLNPNLLKVYYKQDKDKTKIPLIKKSIKEQLTNSQLIYFLMRNYKTYFTDYDRNQFERALRKRDDKNLKSVVSSWLSSLSGSNEGYMLIRTLNDRIRRVQKEAGIGDFILPISSELKKARLERMRKFLTKFDEYQQTLQEINSTDAFWFERMEQTDDLEQTAAIPLDTKVKLLKIQDILK